MAPLGLAEVASLYRLVWYRMRKLGWSNKRGSMLRPWRNFSKTCLSCKRPSESTLMNVRSGLVLVFQHAEWKLATSYGL